jgi:hypothetical protein
MNHDERIAADRERVVEAVRQRVAAGSAIPASLTEVRAVLDALDEAMRESGRARARAIEEVLGIFDGWNICAAADLTPVIEAIRGSNDDARAEEADRGTP